MKTEQTYLNIREQIALLENLDKLFPKIKFDMRVFGYHKKGHKPTEQNYCGTAACQLGSAAMHKPFRKQGLKDVWKFDPEDNTHEGGFPPGFAMTVHYKDSKEYEAAANFFGIENAVANHMFNPWIGNLKTRKACIKAWKEILKYGEREFMTRNGITFYDSQYVG